MPGAGRWVPVRERSRSLALVYSGMYSGSILGLALSPHMIEWLRWPSVFYIFGSLGVVWFLLWGAQVRPPGSHAVSCTKNKVPSGHAVSVRAAHGLQLGFETLHTHRYTVVSPHGDVRYFVD